GQAAAAEGDQQQIAGHHRRQHQRQMHNTVEQRLAQNSLRASSQAMASPNGSATSVATKAMRSDSSTAVHSSGVRLNILGMCPGRSAARSAALQTRDPGWFARQWKEI